MRPALDRALKALVVVACIAWQLGVHASIAESEGGLWRVLLLWTPPALLVAWAIARSRNKAAWLAALVAGGTLVYFIERSAHMGLAALSGLSHAACYLFLLCYFGSTLAPGREPLVTRIARRVHGALEPAMERFTRNLTAAWCVFFALQLVTSALLLAFAPLQAWSLFVNLLNLPLLALMFCGQFVVRALRHPEMPRASLWQVIRVFSQEAALSGRAEVR